MAEHAHAWHYAHGNFLASHVTFHDQGRYAVGLACDCGLTAVAIHRAEGREMHEGKTLADLDLSGVLGRFVPGR